MPKQKKFKGIPLSGGLLTNADIEEVDAQYSTDLINISLEKPGTLTIREGVGDPHTIDTKLITLYRWQDKVQEIGHGVGPCWIGIFRDEEDYSKRQLKISYNTHPSQWTLLARLNSGDIEPKIIDLGGSLRILLGHTSRPVFVDKINRTFFGIDADRNPRIEYNGIFVDDQNLPHSNILTSSVTAVSGGSLDDGFTGDTMYYYYKIAPVYDGHQIGSLPEQLPHKATVTHGATNKTASIVADILKEAWNPRTTHLNIYRASSANVDAPENRTYYLIRSLPTWKSDDFLNETLEYLSLCRRTFSFGSSNLGAETFDDGTALSTYSGAGNDAFNYCFLVTGFNSVNDGSNLGTDTDFSEKNISATTMVYRGRVSDSMFKFQTKPDADPNVYQRCRLNVNYPAYIEDGSSSNWNTQVQGGFQYIRRINKVQDDHAVLDMPFLTDHTPDADDWDGFDSTNTSDLTHIDGTSMTAPKPNLFYVNYGWSQGTSPLHCHAVLHNRNIVKWGKDPVWGTRIDTPVWTLANDGDGRQGGYGHLDHQNEYVAVDELAFGLSPADQHQFGGEGQESQNYSFLAFQRGEGGTYYDSWGKIYYYQEIKQDGLQQGQWYWITFATSYLATTHNATSGPNMGLYITKTDHDISGSGEVLFKMGSQSFGRQNNWHDNNDWKESKGNQMGGWYYHSDADSTNGSPHYICVGVGLSDDVDGMHWSNGGKVENGTDTVGFGYVGIFECLGPPTGSGYFGANTVVVPASKGVDIGDNMSFIDDPGNALYVSDTVNIATDEICKLNDNTPIQSSGLNLLSSMGITDNGDTLEITMKDLGRQDMEPHPSHETSLNVKYKHAKMISGRLFVANVFMSNSEKSEEHPNWIMFSEMNKPDVVPVTNYIGVSDLGNGEITNLEEMNGSLVVFSRNSVYRLHIPSYDPMDWSLMEAVETIGCSADDGLINVQGNLFFCSRDNIYMMDANFTPKPISQYIQATYLNNYTDNVKLRHEPIRNQLYVIFENKECYVLNLNRLVGGEFIWQRICFGDDYSDLDNLNDLIVDENLKSFVVFDDKVSKLMGANIVQEKQRMLKATGWMKLAPQDSNVILRKLHVRYKSNVPLEFLIHIDGQSEADTLIQKDKPVTYDADATNIKATNSASNIAEIPSNCNQDGVILESENRVKSSLNNTTRLGIRCSSFKLIIRSKNTSDPSFKTFCEIYNVEVEYE